MLFRSLMNWFWDHYADTAQRSDPKASPLKAASLAGLPPTTIVTAQFDPLRDEGEAYARKLVEAGVAVEMHRFPDQIHGFLNIVGVGRTSRRAVEQIADALRRGLTGVRTTGPGATAEPRG